MFYDGSKGYTAALSSTVMLQTSLIFNQAWEWWWYVEVWPILGHKRQFPACQARAVIASPSIGHSYHCLIFELRFQPYDSFQDFNIFQIRQVLLCLIKIDLVVHIFTYWLKWDTTFTLSLNSWSQTNPNFLTEKQQYLISNMLHAADYVARRANKQTIPHAVCPVAKTLLSPPVPSSPPLHTLPHPSKRWSSWSWVSSRTCSVRVTYNQGTMSGQGYLWSLSTHLVTNIKFSMLGQCLMDLWYIPTMSFLCLAGIDVEYTHQNLEPPQIGRTVSIWDSWTLEVET